MAHFSVTVCLPAAASADLTAALAAVLAPFGKSTHLEWDQGFLWDSWHVEGGSSGYGFWVMPGCEDDPRLIHDDPDFDGRPRLSRPGQCAGGPRALLDLRPEPALAVALAEQTWDLWQTLARNHPLALPEGLILAQLRHDRSSPTWFHPGQVSAAFEAQPLVQAFRAAHPIGGRDPGRFSSDFLFPLDLLTRVDRIGWSKESFVRDAVQPLSGGTDLLTLDGWWIEPDGAARHGSCGSPCEHTPAEFNLARGNYSFGAGRNRYLASLPEDIYMVRVDGHW